jgi:hypothetical protein
VAGGEVAAGAAAFGEAAAGSVAAAGAAAFGEAAAGSVAARWLMLRVSACCANVA